MSHGGGDLHGRPTAPELLDAVVGFLRDQLSEGLDGPMRYQVRIAVHALEVVSRELQLGPAQQEAHQQRLAALGVKDDAALAEAIRAGDFDDHSGLFDALRADTRDKLLVANPKWLPPETRRVSAMGDERPFEYRGLGHLALVCSDMARTVEFYQDTLGMPLIKTVELPMGMGQHFFFDIGNGDSLAFFWFRDAPPAAPGIAAPAALPGVGEITTAIGSMNHVAFGVPVEQIDAYVERLRERGVECTEVLHHDDSEWGISRDMHSGVFVKSIYFFDPDGICLEFAAWTRAMTPADVRHTPVRATGAPA